MFFCHLKDSKFQPNYIIGLILQLSLHPTIQLLKPRPACPPFSNSNNTKLVSDFFLFIPTVHSYYLFGCYYYFCCCRLPNSNKRLRDIANFRFYFFKKKIIIPQEEENEANRSLSISLCIFSCSVIISFYFLFFSFAIS